MDNTNVDRVCELMVGVWFVLLWLVVTTKNQQNHLLSRSLCVRSLHALSTQGKHKMYYYCLKRLSVGRTFLSLCVSPSVFIIHSLLSDGACSSAAVFT